MLNLNSFQLNKSVKNKYKYYIKKKTYYSNIKKNSDFIYI
jgi:hypothetical protein